MDKFSVTIEVKADSMIEAVKKASVVPGEIVTVYKITPPRSAVTPTE